MFFKAISIELGMDSVLADCRLVYVLAIEALMQQKIDFAHTVVDAARTCDDRLLPPFQRTTVYAWFWTCSISTAWRSLLGPSRAFLGLFLGVLGKKTRIHAEFKVRRTFFQVLDIFMCCLEPF